MAKILVLYYSAYGHIEAMADVQAKAPGRAAPRWTPKKNLRDRA